MKELDYGIRYNNKEESTSNCEGYWYFNYNFDIVQEVYSHIYYSLVIIFNSKKKNTTIENPCFQIIPISYDIYEVTAGII